MSMPLRQSIKVATYLAEQKLRKRDKFPLLVELEPLFACNLKCAGCGKIEQPHDVLKKRMPVEQAVAAVLESGAPMVSIAGGEPLMHKQIDEIVRQLLDRNKIKQVFREVRTIPVLLNFPPAVVYYARR